VRYGYRRLHVLLLREGWKSNHKRVYRWYKLAGLSLRLKSVKKRRSVPRVPLPPARAPNERWSRDFVADRLVDGRRFRLLALVANFSRVSPALEADRWLTGERVVTVVERLARSGRKPKSLPVENGPEFLRKALDAWAYRNGVKLDFSRPGKPTDNAYIASFNGKLRTECLDQHWFLSLQEAQETLETWRKEYNTDRPHTALGRKTPEAFVEDWKRQQSAVPPVLQAVQQALD